MDCGNLVKEGFKNTLFLHAFNLVFMNLPLSRDPERADASIDKGARERNTRWKI
jgi:hypothetical protein